MTIMKRSGRLSRFLRWLPSAVFLCVSIAAAVAADPEPTNPEPAATSPTDDNGLFRDRDLRQGGRAHPAGLRRWQQSELSRPHLCRDEGHALLARPAQSVHGLGRFQGHAGRHPQPLQRPRRRGRGPRRSAHGCDADGRHAGGQGRHPGGRPDFENQRGLDRKARLAGRHRCPARRARTENYPDDFATLDAGDQRLRAGAEGNQSRRA